MARPPALMILPMFSLYFQDILKSYFNKKLCFKQKDNALKIASKLIFTATEHKTNSGYPVFLGVTFFLIWNHYICSDFYNQTNYHYNRGNESFLYDK